MTCTVSMEIIEKHVHGYNRQRTDTGISVPTESSLTAAVVRPRLVETFCIRVTIVEILVALIDIYIQDINV